MAVHNRLSLIGRRFGKLTVIADAGTVQFRSRWLCKCDCGNVAEIVGNSLTAGNTSSCGCLHAEAAAARKRSDGMRGTRTYRIWQAMLNRCRNSNVAGYCNWGGRGIRVDEEWLSFDAFFRDMGKAPDGMSIDRYPDKDGNYEKSNCRWATRSEQMRNTRANRIITFKGVTKCLIEWAESLRIDQASLRERLEKWSLDAALTTPKMRN